MSFLKYILLTASLFASSEAFALEPSYDLQHIYELTNSLGFSHWAEELMPGAPEKGVLLFKIVSLSITLPLFAILLIWGIISDLQSNAINRIDYTSLAKRIFIFIVFLGFGTSIYGYLNSLQRGMHSIIEIVCSQDSDFFLKAFYKESATNQNKLTRAISAGKEDAINNLLNTAKELVKYKDKEKGAIRTVTRAHYMAIPFAAYNESLLLYSGDKQMSLPSGSGLRIYRNATPYMDQYPALIAGENGKTLRGASIVAYGNILKNYSEYPTVYSKNERDARASLNDTIKEILSNNSQNTEESVPTIASSPNPRPPSDADLADFLIESISKNSEPNIALPKFVKEQIFFLIEYDPIIRQGINRIIWELYNRDTSELDGLSIEETELKISAAKCATTPEEARKYALPKNYETLLKERVAQLIIAHATVIGSTKSVMDGETAMSPSAFLEELTKTPAWYQRAWDWSSSKIQSACSMAAGALKSIADIPQRFFEKIVEWFVQLMFWLEKIIVYVMVVIASYVLTLQFFFASITSCFIGCKQTENIFYYNFKLCLHFALIPFMCMLLLTIFNVVFNNMWSSLVPPPNGITTGIGGAAIVGTLAAPSAALAAGGYAIQIALVICIFQIAGMLFLTVYSIKAAGILVRGGGIGGSLLAAAGAGLLAGKVAASAFGMSMGAPAASSISGLTKQGGSGASGASGTGDSGQQRSSSLGSSKNTPKNSNLIPMPPDTSKDKESQPHKKSQSPTTNNMTASSRSDTPNRNIKQQAPHSPTNTNSSSNTSATSKSEPIQSSSSQQQSSGISESSPKRSILGKYVDFQKKTFRKTNPRMGLWMKGAAGSIFPSITSGKKRDTNNGI